MTRPQFDGLMAQVLELHPEVADVIITTGKPIQAEVHGTLKDAITTVRVVALDTPSGVACAS